MPDLPETRLYGLPNGEAMTFVSFRDLEIAQRRLFDQGAYGQKVGMTLFRQNFTSPPDTFGGHSTSWQIIRQGIQGTLLPEEGALRALAEGVQTVEDYRFICDQLFGIVNGDYQELIQANDRMCQGVVTIDGTNQTYTADGPVFRVQYVMKYMNNLWQVRLKVGQDGRT